MYLAAVVFGAGPLFSRSSKNIFFLSIRTDHNRDTNQQIQQRFLNMIKTDAYSLDFEHKRSSSGEVYVIRG